MPKPYSCHINCALCWADLIPLELTALSASCNSPNDLPYHLPYIHIHLQPWFQLYLWLSLRLRRVDDLSWHFLHAAYREFLNYWQQKKRKCWQSSAWLSAGKLYFMRCVCVFGIYRWGFPSELLSIQSAFQAFEVTIIMQILPFPLQLPMGNSLFLNVTETAL